MSELDRAEFDALFDEISAVAPPPSGRGALTRITPELAIRAAGLVRSGARVSLGHAWEITGSADNRRPALHYMSKVAEQVGAEAEPTLYCDFVGADFHDKRITHIDALNHVAYRGKVFGGVDAAGLVTGHGMSALDAADLGPIFTRGVLFDMARVAGLPWVEPTTAWTVEDLELAEAQLGVSLEPGDALLLRSGSVRRRAELGGSDPDVSAGLHARSMRWLSDRGIAVLGADDSSDARPSPVEGVSLPVHTLAMVAMGVPLLDNLDLEQLSEVCAQHSRWQFLFTVSALNIPGGTGSPVNPMAIF
jgi:kynurenine formamidase